MPLPKINTPTYELVIPSTGKKIRYRPFLVKEEKILIMAMESEDTAQITNAVKDVIKSCISTRGVKVEELATFDIEYLFLNIRGKSVGEVSEFKITCPDDEETKVDIQVNLDEVKVQIPKEHTNKLQVSDEITITMKYPSLDVFVKNNLVDNPGVDDLFKLAATCTDSIAEGEDVYEGKDHTTKELVEFYESMDSVQFSKVQKFFETMPKLTHTIEVFNPKTEVTSPIVLEGLASFFA